MNNRRKIICILISIIIVFNIHGIAAVENIEAAEILETNQYSEILCMLKIIDSATVYMNKGISRGEVADAAVYLKTNNKNSETNKIFIDVSASHPYFNSIGAAYDWGIMKGKGNNKFEPDEKVSAQELAAVMLRVLGYDTMIGNETYLTKAMSIGLFGGVTVTSQEVSYRDFIRVIYNSLEIPLAVKSIYGNDNNVTYAIDTDKTLLSERFSLRKINGVVTDNGITSLTDKSNLAKYEVSIDNIRYLSSTPDFKDYLGNYVQAYVTINEEDDKSVVVFMKKTSRNSQIVFSAEEIISFQNFTYTVRNSNDKIITIKMDTKYNLIYNGVATTDYKENYFVPVSGDVRLVDNNGDELYDIIFTREYENIIVDSIDYEKSIVYSKYGTSHLVLTDTEKYCFNDKDGNDLELNDIAIESVLSVMKSADPLYYVSAIVSNDSISGEIMELGTEEIVIGDKTYKKSKQFFLPSEVAIGTFGVAKIDFTGELATFIFKGTTDYKLAYLIQVEPQGSSVDNRLAMKVLDSDGRVVIYKCETKLTIDGFVSKDTVSQKKAILKYLDGQTADPPITGMVIRYKTNDKGLVYDIDTPVLGVENKDTLQLSFEYTLGLRYITIPKSFGGKVIADENTICFFVPSTRNIINGDSSNYGVKKVVGLNNDSNFDIEAYKVNSNSPFASVLVMYDQLTGVNDDTPIAIITNITKTVDANGESLDKVYCLIDGNEQSYMAEPGSVTMDIAKDSLGIGDTVRFTINSKGRIEKFERLYDYKYKIATPNNRLFYDQFRVIYGSVIDVNDSIMKVLLGMHPGEAIHNPNSIEYHPLKLFSIYKVYSNGNKINVVGGGLSDIKSWQKSGEDYSKIIICTRKGEPKTLIIYE